MQDNCPCITIDSCGKIKKIPHTKITEKNRQYAFKGVKHTDKDGPADTLRRERISQMRAITILHLETTLST